MWSHWSITSNAASDAVSIMNLGIVFTNRHVDVLNLECGVGDFFLVFCGHRDPFLLFVCLRVKLDVIVEPFIQRSYAGFYSHYSVFH